MVAVVTARHDEQLAQVAVIVRFGMMVRSGNRRLLAFGALLYNRKPDRTVAVVVVRQHRQYQHEYAGTEQDDADACLPHCVDTPF